MPILASYLLSLTTLTQGGEFLATPEHRWAFEGVALAYREGALFWYPDDAPRRDRNRMRYEMAVFVHAAVENQTQMTEQALTKGTDVERAAMIRARALLPFYRRGAEEFKLEFAQLGVLDDFGIANLERLGDRLSRQSSLRSHLFADVPVGHWAAKAVGDLRALGMLDGYPDGRFRP